MLCDTVTFTLFQVNPGFDLEDVGMPPPIPKRGRPKGTETTVIGIPRKKRRLATRPMPFVKVSSSEKEHSRFCFVKHTFVVPSPITVNRKSVPMYKNTEDKRGV